MNYLKVGDGVFVNEEQPVDYDAPSRMVDVLTDGFMDVGTEYRSPDAIAKFSFYGGCFWSEHGTADCESMSIAMREYDKKRMIRERGASLREALASRERDIAELRRMQADWETSKRLNESAMPYRYKPASLEHVIAAIADHEEYIDNFKVADQFAQDVADLIEGDRIAATTDACVLAKEGTPIGIDWRRQGYDEDANEFVDRIAKEQREGTR